jgi:hypothetical protein
MASENLTAISKEASAETQQNMTTTNGRAQICHKTFMYSREYYGRTLANSHQGFFTSPNVRLE